MADRLCSGLQNCVGEFNSLPRLHCDFMGIKLIDERLISKVLGESKNLERKRLNYNFHKDYNDPIQRILNVFNPGTYIRPHKHENPDKTEVFIILSGRVAVVIFGDKGDVKDAHILDSDGPVHGIEIEPRTWHSFVALETSAVYEIKNGPWDINTDKKFASWAPEEGSRESSKFLEKMTASVKDDIGKRKNEKSAKVNGGTVIIAVGIVRYKDKYLVLKRHENSRNYPNLYEPVCGYVKEFESGEECVLREIREESGLNGKILKQGEVFVVTDERGRWVVVPFLAEVDSGSVKLSSEHTDYKWIKPNELDGNEFIRGIKKDFASVGIK